MLDFATTACKRLIKKRHPAALLRPCLSLLSLTNKSQDYDICETETNLGELVPQWPELNVALFWYDVEDARTLYGIRHKGERLTNWWQVHVFRDLRHFEHKDINQVVKWITQKEFIDDRLVALTLAFSIYRDAGRPQSLRKRLWNVVKGDKELSATLKRLLNPPAMSDEERRFRRKQAHWKRRGGKSERGRTPIFTTNGAKTLPTIWSTSGKIVFLAERGSLERPTILVLPNAITRQRAKPLGAAQLAGLGGESRTRGR